MWAYYISRFPSNVHMRVTYFFTNYWQFWVLKKNKTKQNWKCWGPALTLLHYFKTWSHIGNTRKNYLQIMNFPFIFLNDISIHSINNRGNWTFYSVGGITCGAFNLWMNWNATEITGIFLSFEWENFVTGFVGTVM